MNLYLTNFIDFEKLLQAILNYLPTFFIAIFVFAIGIIVSRLIVKLLAKGLEKGKLDKTAHEFVKSLVRVSLYTLVSVIALSTLGVQMSSIIAVIAAAGLAVGLALQNSLSNLAGGFIILFTKPFKVGDYIESNGIGGSVQHISILNTKLLTPDNKSVYIPNGQVSGGKIINFTEESTRRLDMNFGISYEDDFEKAKKILLEIINNHPLTLSTPEPFVRMGEQATSCIIITVRIWVLTENYWTLNFDMLELVKTAFDREKISIPFEQLDVRIANSNT